MRIKEIVWKNYRQYRDAHISFPKNKTNDLHYFIAENGIGKTTFFNSVNWCLYDDEPYLQDKDRAFSILSKSTKKKMNTGDRETVSVKLTIETEQGDIQYLREAEMRLVEDGSVSEVDNHLKVTTIYRGEESKTYKDDEAVMYVNKFVPKKLRDYYFFDAESLKDYFTSESNEKVKKAVFEISDIETLKTMQSHLEEVGKNYRLEATKNNPKTKEMNDELNRFLDEKAKKEADKEKAQSEKELAEKEFDRNNRILEQSEDAEEIEARRAELTDLIHEYEDKEKNIRLSTRTFIKRYTILINSYENMKKLYEKLNEMDTNEELPPKIKPEYLQQMIGANRCLICDRELDEHGFDNISRLLNRHRSTKTLTELSSIRGILQTLMEETKQYESKRDEILSHWNEIRDALDRFTNEKRDIDLKYDQIPDLEKLKYASKMRSYYESEKEKKREEVINLKRDIDELTDKINNLNEELLKEKAKEGKKQNADYCYNLVAKGSKVIASIIEDIRDEVREKISENTGKQFLDLIWKKVTYASVGLTEDYAISARDEDGQEGAGSTSGAEGQLLALSFILALQSVSGYDSPLIIDTPVARTSGALRTNFCEALKKVSEEKQVILFFTEDEFNSRVKNSLQGFESNKYVLSLIDENYVEVK